MSRVSGRRHPRREYCSTTQYYGKQFGETNHVFPQLKGITDLTTRELCIELARRFRDIANVKSLTQQSDIEVVHLAERMVGKTPRPDKH